MIDALPPCGDCADGSAAGVPGQWQLVVNAQKSRLSGIGIGGFIEGEPRSSDTAWINYEQWEYSRAVEAGVAVFPGGPVRGSHWSAVAAFDLVTLVGWRADSGVAQTIRFNFALGDTDEEGTGDPVYGLRHEMWWSVGDNATAHPPYFLSSFAPLVLEPGRRP